MTTATADFAKRLDQTAEDTEALLAKLLSDTLLPDEIARPKRRIARLLQVWFDRIVPLIGRVIGQGGAYGYLVRSVKGYPEPERIAAIMREAPPGLCMDAINFTLSPMIATVAPGGSIVACARNGTW